MPRMYFPRHIILLALPLGLFAVPSPAHAAGRDAPAPDRRDPLIYAARGPLYRQALGGPAYTLLP
jgi:hypothetical protein